MISVLACVASVVLSGPVSQPTTPQAIVQEWRQEMASASHICVTGDGGLPCIDILLTGIPDAKVGDIIDMDISIVAQQDKDATAGQWAGVEVLLGWDPAMLEPISHSLCESLFKYFKVFLFTSDDPANLYYDCVNQDLDPVDLWPDNDGDLSIIYFAPLGTENNIFAIPQILGTMQFRVLAEGTHTVSIIDAVDCWFPDNPDVFPIETGIVGFGNTQLLGDISDTFVVEVRSSFDALDPPGIGIEDFLAFLNAWAAGL